MLAGIGGSPLSVSYLAARDVRDEGTPGFAAQAIPFTDVSWLMAGPRESSSMSPPCAVALQSIY